PIHSISAEKTRGGGALADPIRGGRSFFCAAAAGCASSNFDSGGNRADEFYRLQHLDVLGIGDFLFASGVSRRARATCRAEPAERSRGTGAFRPRPIEMASGDSARVRSALRCFDVAF